MSNKLAFIISQIEKISENKDGSFSGGFNSVRELTKDYISVIKGEVGPSTWLMSENEDCRNITTCEGTNTGLSCDNDGKCSEDPPPV